MKEDEKTGEERIEIKKIFCVGIFKSHFEK
jgi:hypothetical protein